jgi:hypothetical protein
MSDAIYRKTRNADTGHYLTPVSDTQRRRVRHGCQRAPAGPDSVADGAGDLPADDDDSAS